MRMLTSFFKKRFKQIHLLIDFSTVIATEHVIGLLLIAFYSCVSSSETATFPFQQMMIQSHYLGTVAR